MPAARLRSLLPLPLSSPVIPSASGETTLKVRERLPEGVLGQQRRAFRWSSACLTDADRIVDLPVPILSATEVPPQSRIARRPAQAAIAAGQECHVLIREYHRLQSTGRTPSVKPGDVYRSDSRTTERIEQSERPLGKSVPQRSTVGIILELPAP